MKWLLIVVAVLALLVVIVAGVGMSLPQNHVASRTATLTARPVDVWAAITDVAKYPEWRKDVTRVEVASASPLKWAEFSGRDRIAYEATALEPSSHFVARISDKALPFGGSWDYRIEPLGTGTKVTITENGEVYNPIFRFVSRFVMGHTATIDKYLAALAEKTGGTYVPST
jgi:hypothetical protein